MRLIKLALIGLLLGLSSPAMAQSGCGGQFGALRFCGSIAGGLPGPVLIPAGGTTPIAGGTVLGNPTAVSALPVATPTPVLGIPGTSTGQLGLAGSGSGTAILKGQAAAGSATSLLPTVSGTLVSSASSPLVANAVTGQMTCPTCVTSSGGGPITGTAPITVSAAGVVALSTPLALNFGGTNANLTASNGGILWSDATKLNILAGTATARQMLQSGASTTPAWSTSIWPATTTINRLLFSNAANTVGEVSTVNGGMLNANSSGVPSMTITPVLGVPASSQGTLGFAGVTGGTATVTAQATAGSPTITLPNTSGTLADGASSPLVLSSTTGNLTCPTCTTSAASLTANQLVIGSGSQGEQSLGTLGTTTTVLHGNAAGAPSFAGVSLTADVTGQLPFANGGCNGTTQQSCFDQAAPTATRAGDVIYWNGTHYVTLAGNNSGTNVFTENASGVPSWSAPGTGTVTSVTCGTGLSGGTFTTIGTCALALTNATLQAAPSNPTGASASSVMMGLGVSTCRITPVYSGRLLVHVDGQINATASTVNITTSLRFGTGAGPANGAAATGTPIGSSIATNLTASQTTGLTGLGGIITGLSVGTAVWLDMTLSSSTGTSTVTNLSCSAMEF